MGAEDVGRTAADEVAGRFSAGLDLARVPFEVTRATEDAGLTPEMLPPYLRTRLTDDRTGLEVFERSTDDQVAMMPGNPVGSGLRVHRSHPRTLLRPTTP